MIRSKVFSKLVSHVLLSCFIFELFIPLSAFSITGGPNQPEASGFQPASADQMVDPFTGDFRYHIPLLNVGGFPVAMHYAAGISPEDESSWVGLGWNLNIGAVSRNVRGIPDDFAGDKVISEHKVKPNQTFGITFKPAKKTKDGEEVATFKLGLSQNYSLSYNNYTGFALSASFARSWDVALSGKEKSSKYKLGLTPALSFSIGSEGGVGITPSVSNGKGNSSLGAKIGFPYSTKEGFKGRTMSTSFNFSGDQSYSGAHNGAGGSDVYGTATAGGSFSNNSFKGFAGQSYPTSINYDTYRMSATFSIEPEKVKLVQDKKQSVLGGFFTGEYERSNRDVNKAYGYMYEGVSNSPRDVMDFNREKDQGFQMGITTNMPLTSHTHDIFSVSGEGIGGTYRLFRSDVVNVGDNVNSQRSVDGDLALSGGINTTTEAPWQHYKLGVDVKVVTSNAISGRWGDDRIQQLANPLSAKNSVRENVYFGQIGDVTPENDLGHYDATFLGTDLYRYDIYKNSITGKYVKGNGEKGILKNNHNSDYTRSKRRNRTNPLTYLTAKEASKHAMHDVYSYNENDFTVAKKSLMTELTEDLFGQNKASDVYAGKIKLDRVSGVRKPDHLSEIKVTNSNGQRYVYGIPVYNKKQEDVVFSVGAGSSDTKKTGLVSYSKTDASIGNKKGLQNYFDRTIQPGYSSSFLLTYILSSDYVDSDDIPGPSDGDLGTYVKFNYAKTSSGYKWRTPFQRGKANYAEGLQGKGNDDKGSYVYGEKEIWYLHSIENRTHVAEFHLKDRLDGIGVKDEFGGLESDNINQISDNNIQKRIEKIVLYAKRDKLNGRNEPLKTVHFDYDYSLCPGTPNSLAANKGKLSLKKVWFTYGNSNKGVENPYKFEYANTDFSNDGVMEVNYSYETKSQDRWGIYKKEEGLGNEIDPYTIQDKTIQDQYSASYAMTRIFTPNGGETRIHYESDDYAYVQNKRAMRMFTTLGVSSSKNTSVGNLSSILYTGSNDLSERKFLYVDLGEGFVSDNLVSAQHYFKDEYLKGINELTYKVKIRVYKSNSGNRDANEYVTGYCKINANNINVIASVPGSNEYKVGVIELLPESLSKGRVKNIHPFVRNGWLFARLHYNRELAGSVDADANGFIQVLSSIAAALDGLLDLFTGFKNAMVLNKHSDRFVAQESFVRLNDPDRIKIGGGYRVKAIINFDRWDEMLSNREQSSGNTKEVAGYGQVYSYTMTDEGQVISSGVAAYEPIIGGEENALRNLVKVGDRIPAAPDKEYYSETPYGESFFPAPVVGYRQVVTTPVKVIDKNYDVDELQSNGTGYVQEEFYTAFDFPTRVSQTNLEINQEKSSTLNPLKNRSHDYVTCSQGYLIEVNDMHGKVKSTKVMPDPFVIDQSPVSYVEYRYKTAANDASKLDSRIPLVNSQLKVDNSLRKELGTTVDVVNDTRVYNNVIKGGGANGNGKLSLFPSVPPVIIPIITVFPEINGEVTSFSSITTTKVVNRYAVLDETIVHENGQQISTQNLLWDEQTGQVLLTKVDNEFNDPIYKFTYPAYWVYPEMGFAYQNLGLIFDNLADVQALLIDGDEVAVETDTEKLHAYYNKTGVNSGELLTKSGDVISSFNWAKVVRSGARNVPSVPVGEISMLKNPVVGNTLSFDDKKILGTSATEFRNVWKGFCNCGEQSIPTRNPFISGEKGQLRVWRNWTYLTGRTQGSTNGELDIRKDGVFIDFQPFWNVGVDNLDPIYYSVDELAHKWQFITEIENYNPIGQQIEDQDALHRYSMSQIGYARSLPVGVANNSRYNETGYDGFEDYNYTDCNDDHFSWRVRVLDENVEVDSTQAHSGRRSIKLAPNTRSKIVKIISECGE